MPLMRLSYAHVCHVANVTQVVEYEGTCMTEDLANAIEAQPHRFTVRVEQLRATRRHLADSPKIAPFTRRNVPSRFSKKQIEENRLLNIPFEIRQNMWKCLAEDHDSMPFDCATILFPHLNPMWWALSRSSEVFSRLSLECILESLKYYPITQDYQYSLELDRLRELLNTIDFSDVDTHYKTGFDAVRPLWLRAYPIYGSKHGGRKNDPYMGISLLEPLSFALRCRNLTNLTLDINPNIWAFFTETADLWLVHSQTHLRISSDLDKVLEFERLKVLRLGFDAGEIATMPNLEKFMHDLTFALQEEIRARGKRIRVHWTTLHFVGAVHEDRVM